MNLSECVFYNINLICVASLPKCGYHLPGEKQARSEGVMPTPQSGQMLNFLGTNDPFRVRPFEV